MKRLAPLDVPLAGTTLVEASAGTGKTYTLATLYLRLLLEERLQVGQILVVTYTNAATAELRDRIRRRLREAVAYFEHLEHDPAAAGAVAEAPHELGLLAARCRDAGALVAARKHLATALRGFDEAAIFTIHGFCQRILLENAFESGVLFEAELVTDQGPLCDEVVNDFWVRALHDAPRPLVERALVARLLPESLVRLARKVLTHRDMEALPAELVVPSRAEFQRLVAEWHAAAAVAAPIWESCRAEVEALLTEPGRLNGNVYRATTVVRWCEQLGALLATPPDRLPEFPAWLGRLTPDDLAANTNRRQVTPRHPFFDACARLFAARQALGHAFDAFELGLQRELVDFVRREVARRHESANTQSFDDLLYRLRDALRRPTGAVLATQIRERFRAALIDEFQDTDPVQYEIFRTVYAASGLPLFLIGDPKQAIYGFRGADVFTYGDAKAHAGARSHTLETNHRSTARLVEGVNALFGRARSPFVFDDIPFTRATPAQRDDDGRTGGLDGAGLEVLFARSPGGPATGRNAWAERGIPAAVASDVVRLLNARPRAGGRELHAGDVAVLCRTNKQATAMQAELRRRGVPSVLAGDDSVFETVEAEEVERVLRAVAEPGEPRLLRAALATRLAGLDAQDLAALQGDETAWDTWAGRFRDWLAVWIEHGFMAAFRRLLDACETQRRLLALEDGERRLTNLLHLGELLQTASREAHRGPLALVDWLKLMRGDAAARAEMAGESAQIRLESDEKAVQLVTVHRSKGLEYGVVYCPFTWEGMELHAGERTWIRFHDPEDGRRLKIDLGTELHGRHLQRARLEDFAENLRLLYVAVTRARHRCSLVWACTGRAAQAPLGYLLHQPAGASDGPELVTATQARLERLGEDEMLAELRALEEGSAGAVAVRALEVMQATAASPPRYEPPREAEAEPPRIAVAARALDAAWRVSSFSGLAASGGRTSHQAAEGVDRDEGQALAAIGAAAAAPARPQAGPVLLHELRTGARTGELLHWILEHLDFTRGDPAELEVRVREGFARFAMDARWEDAVRRGLEEALATPLLGDAGDLTLGDIAPASRQNELPFLLAVRRRFDRAALARCFEHHPSPLRPADYPARLRRLGFAALEGYLSGFVDLVFEHAGRFYVADYKSSFLGAEPERYEPGRLVEAMSLHHYFLQYHLYVLAVHRHLRARLPGYEYERHFGGVYYLFLRGMSPRHAPGTGVFHDRPAAALIDELSAMVGEPERGGRS